MRGIITGLNSFGGYIRPFKRAVNDVVENEKCHDLSFANEDISLYDILSLKKGCIVDYYVNNDTEKVELVYPAQLVWCTGRIEKIEVENVEIGSLRWWVDGKFENSKGEIKKRQCFFRQFDLLPGEDPSTYRKGDVVRFKMDYWSERNEALSVTKRQIGYITDYNKHTKKCTINFSKEFYVSSNTTELENLDFNSLSYVITYDYMPNDENCICISQVIEPVSEVSFENNVRYRYIDGMVTEKGTSKNGEKYVIVKVEGTKCSKRVSVSNNQIEVPEIDLTEGERVSFYLDDKGKVSDYMRIGYITRFPAYSNGRINKGVYKNQIEQTESDLYFRKYKLNRGFHISPTNEKDFLAEGLLFGEKVKVAINTFTLRFKVRFYEKEDFDQGRKAVGIDLLGIAKSPKCENSIIGVKNDADIIPSTAAGIPTNQMDDLQGIANGQTTNIFYILNNNCGTVNQSLVHQEKNIHFTIENFLTTIDNGNYASYVKSIGNNVSEVSQRLDDDLDMKADLIADRLFPDVSSVADIPTNQMKSLDDKYNSVRDIHPEIEDSLLEKLTPECSLYLKVAVIIEDALKDLQYLPIGDFSAQMVMYGKALEQCLRDCLYDLSHNDEELKTFVFNQSNSMTFENAPRDKTMIGNYTFILKSKLDRFSFLRNSFIQDVDLLVHSAWWTKLRQNIDKARELRNRSDHAGEYTIVEDIKEMVSLLVCNKEESIIANLLEVKNIQPITNQPLKDKEALISVGSIADFAFLRQIPNNRNPKETFSLNGFLNGNKSNMARIKRRELRTNHFPTEDEIKLLVEHLKQSAFIKVRVVSQSENGYEVSLIGAPIGFDDLIKSKSPNIKPCKCQ